MLAGEAMTPEQVMSLKAKVAQSKLAQASSGMAGKSPQLGLAKQKPKQKRAVFVDDDGNIIGEEEEDEDITDAPTPSFTLSFGEEGTEFTEFDATGAIKRQSKSSLLDINDDDPLDEGEVDERFDDDDDDLDFSAGSADTEGWQQLKAAQRQRTQPQPPAALAKAPARKRQPAINFQEDGDTLSLSARDVEALLGDEGAAGAGMLLAGTEQEEEEQEWGLEEICDRRSEVTMRTTP
ncbi:hypothetical protein QJQ45_023281 [Haematococcus lacustris]|nr:hypothetical protein QJQ45_023281 [Haematococcus lacustris]